MKALGRGFMLAHGLLFVLILLVLLPGARMAGSPAPFLCAIVLCESISLALLLCRRETARTLGDRLLVVYGILLLWELGTTKLNWLHPILFPSPEQVFSIFSSQWRIMLGGVFSSLRLLFFGLAAGICAGVLAGLYIGWNDRLCRLFLPIAGVLAPIPPVVYGPYLVAIMPTFRSASACIILLGIFFPALLGNILRVRGMEPRIIDSARALNVKGVRMLLHVLIPYALPGVVSSLRVTLSTSIMLLIFAEMMGATSGMGYYIINSIHYANYTNVVAGIILVGIVVLLLNRITQWVQKHAIKWQ